MARPKTCRRICALPCEREFIPASGEKGVVSLSLDELETLRLLDLERLTQEECALQMGVARATAALIYDSARRKVAAALVLGQRLIIGGGDVIVCGNAKHCCRRCGKRECSVCENWRCDNHSEGCSAPEE